MESIPRAKRAILTSRLSVSQKIRPALTAEGLGGMLDVMDSLLFTVPVVYFYLTMVLGLERL